MGDLVELPEGRERQSAVSGCLRLSMIVNGCLVAKGYSQMYFEETFAPVVRFSSLRTLLVFVQLITT